MRASPACRAPTCARSFPSTGADAISRSSRNLTPGPRPTSRASCGSSCSTPPGRVSTTGTTPPCSNRSGRAAESYPTQPRVQERRRHQGPVGPEHPGRQSHQAAHHAGLRAEGAADGQALRRVPAEHGTRTPTPSTSWSPRAASRWSRTSRRQMQSDAIESEQADQCPGPATTARPAHRVTRRWLTVHRPNA